MKTTILFLITMFASIVFAQPQSVREGVRFVYAEKAQRIAVVGSFNGWNISANPMSKTADNRWEAVLSLDPGDYQYKFLVDGNRWIPDPANPTKFDDNFGGVNSCFTVNEFRQIELRAPRAPQQIAADNAKDEYAAGPTIYLNLIWHQHQPLYLNPATDELEGPWVRTHATKDYYDMTALIGKYPDVHATVNLTTVLLNQLQSYYVERLRPLVDPNKLRIDSKRYFELWKHKTDPWVDLALQAPSTFSTQDKAHIATNAWSAFAVSDVIANRWPDYQALRAKPRESLTDADLQSAIGYFYLVQFDPDFYQSGGVKLVTGHTIDLSDLVTLSGSAANPQYRLHRPLTTDDNNRLVASATLVMEAIIPLHKQLMFHAETGAGQVEVITTPYYHPILPLLIDTQIAKRCQPQDTLPTRFRAPEDAMAQVTKAVNSYHEWYGAAPSGMWPGEGSIAPEILPLLSMNDIQWTASDRQVLARSAPANLPVAAMYACENVALVFRDTDLSDRIGFRYQRMDPEAAAEDFVQGVLAYSKTGDSPLVTVILDGENAWENYVNDNDGKQFLNALYRKLSKLYQTKRIVTVTPSEYIAGNASRGVAAHPITALPKLSYLHSGSWIYGNYDTWIGEREENIAWEWLKRVRDDLVKSGIHAPDLSAPMPAKNSRAYYERKAWEALYAAEGSDWFWWYGADQNAPGGSDAKFDESYRTLLSNVYRFAKLAGAKIEEPKIPPLLITDTAQPSGGVMQPGSR